MKILFVAPNLNAGGAEKVFVTIVNNLSEIGYNCEVILLKKEGKLLDRLSEDIVVHDVGNGNIIYKLFALKKLISEKSPDLVFSIIGHVNVMLAFLKFFFFRRLRFVARENAVHSVWFKQDINLKKKILLILYKILLKKLDLVIVQTEFMKTDVINMFRLKESQVVVISNPIDFEQIDYLKNQPLDNEILWDESKEHIIAVGRLEDVKDYPRMIQMMKKIPDNFVLDIFGIGKENKNLKTLIYEINVEDKVFLHGYNRNVYKYMTNSEFLIITSKRESFPNVVIEANACSIPALSLNIPGGISEVISIDNINGKIFDKECELENFIKNGEFKYFSKSKIRDFAEENFSISDFMDKILKVIISKGD
ncbi:glycosyltransferase [Enterococcus sp. DIV0876]|uniref:glycosyltransferase n=1 Tax=Enterococcus sp. DIV0876 TaxID=2774633 RepID=UPI003D2FE1E9